MITLEIIEMLWKTINGRNKGGDMLKRETEGKNVQERKSRQDGKKFKWHKACKKMSG